MAFKFDEIGYWSEIKLDIIENMLWSILKSFQNEEIQNSTTSILMLLLALEHTFREQLETLCVEVLREL